MTTHYQQPITQYKDGLFNSYTGVLINIQKPDASMIKLEDIARALSKICRFGGHSKKFYSVAQHSALVAELAPTNLKFAALMHDAAEAYIGDLIKPLKHIVSKSYEGIEEAFNKAICDRFKIDYNSLAQLKAYDVMALELEYEYLIKGNEEQWVINMRGLDLATYALDHDMAYFRFWQSFHRHAPADVHYSIMHGEGHIGTL